MTKTKNLLLTLTAGVFLLSAIPVFAQTTPGFRNSFDMSLADGFALMSNPEQNNTTWAGPGQIGWIDDSVPVDPNGVGSDGNRQPCIRSLTMTFDPECLLNHEIACATPQLTETPYFGGGGCQPDPYAAESATIYLLGLNNDNCTQSADGSVTKFTCEHVGLETINQYNDVVSVETTTPYVGELIFLYGSFGNSPLEWEVYTNEVFKANYAEDGLEYVLSGM